METKMRKTVFTLKMMKNKADEILNQVQDDKDVGCREKSYNRFLFFKK